jgi:hypothetical protein
MSSRLRTWILIAASLAAGYVAAVAVAAAFATPTLKASHASITFSRNLALTGTVAGARKGNKVHLLSRTCGFTGPAETQQAKTTAKGTYRFFFQPAITTVFSVTWNNKTSRRVRVVVRPLVQLRRVGSGRFSVDVSAGAGSFFTGKTILIQRAAGRRWVSVGQAKLKQNSSVTAITAVSSATVRARVSPRALVRAFLSPTAAAPCYGASKSPVIRA